MADETPAPAPSEQPGQPGGFPGGGGFRGRGPGGPGRGPGRGPGGPGRGPGRGPRGPRQDSPKDANGNDLVEKTVFINRCAKVVKGGRRFSFSALLVIGDKAGK